MYVKSFCSVMTNQFFASGLTTLKEPSHLSDLLKFISPLPHLPTLVSNVLSPLSCAMISCSTNPLSLSIL